MVPQNHRRCRHRFISADLWPPNANTQWRHQAFPRPQSPKNKPETRGRLPLGKSVVVLWRGWVKPVPAARGSQETEFVQPLREKFALLITVRLWEVVFNYLVTLQRKPSEPKYLPTHDFGQDHDLGSFSFTSFFSTEELACLLVLKIELTRGLNLTGQ